MKPQNKKAENSKNIQKQHKETKQLQQQQQPKPQPKPQPQQQPIPEPTIEITAQYQLPKVLQQIDEDRGKGKISFLIDTTGNAYTFFKYQGRLLDVSEMIVKEAISGQEHEKSVEEARIALLQSLRAGTHLVISLDLKTANLNDFFKSQWFDSDIIFNYDKITNENYYKIKLLKEGENVDVYGNKNAYCPHGNFKITLLVTDESGTFDPTQYLKTIGLFNIRDQFKVSKIIE